MSLRRLCAALSLPVLMALSGCGGGNGSGDPSTSAPPAAQSSSLGLSADSYSVAQDAGAMMVTVNRSGGSQGAASVGYATIDGSAKAGSDYTAVTGTLNWLDGDAAPKSFSVPVSNGSAFSGSRDFSVTLANAGGAATLGTLRDALITILGRGGSLAPIGSAAASRLLSQGSFGATMGTLDSTAAQSYDQWFAAQAQAAPSLTYPYIKDAKENTNWIPGWWRNTVLGPDQLRQRMAFALSEILVISQQAGALNANNNALAIYYDLLTQNALGTYRDLLEKVTLSLQMGVFLNMYHSDKADPATGVHADQNYARESMQLFTVGLVQLNPDGTPKLDGNGKTIPTYGFAQVEGLANAFTGWASNPTTQTGEQAYRYDYDFTQPMAGYENHHDSSAKSLIGGVTIPAGGTTASDLKIALDTLVNHPNTAPFISRQLIQRLVTSNPSPAYVQRVATVFANNGKGVRGDLLAVAKAILTDPEAVKVGGNNDGKLREPLLRLTNLWRAFGGTGADGNVNEYGIVQNAYELTGEQPLNASTVFNFFQPDYVRAGPLATAGRVAPEFQISNENTLVQTANQYQRQVYQFVDSSGKTYAGYQGFDESQNLGTSSVLLHTAPWESLADNPANLIDKMNQLLMQGQMPAAMRSTLINYVSAIPSTEATYKARRVVEAADLLINSPQYAIQR